VITIPASNIPSAQDLADHIIDQAQQAVEDLQNMLLGD